MPGELVVIQVRPGTHPPPWWPRDGKKVHWVTLRKDGLGWEIARDGVLDTTHAVPSHLIRGIKRIWKREHRKCDWRWRTWTRREQ